MVTILFVYSLTVRVRSSEHALTPTFSFAKWVDKETTSPDDERLLQVSPKTLVDLQIHLQFSPIFLDLLLSGRHTTEAMTTGNFLRYDDNDELVGVG